MYGRIVILLILFFLHSISFINCDRKKKSDKLIIFHAGSLTAPFKALAKEFELKYPDIDVECESSGSRIAIKKVTEMNRQADIVASSDYTEIEALMLPKHAEWYIQFVKNQVVIAYTNRSKYKDEITPDNWYEILQRKDVRWAHSDPNQDPCGYRALLVIQLAGLHYKKPGLAGKLRNSCTKEYIRPKEVELISLLTTGELDYAFCYRSDALQHKLKFVTLPVEINLSSGSYKYKEFYNKAKIRLKDGKVKTAEPIIYGITIPKVVENKEAAIKFIQLLLSEKGMKIMKKNGFLPMKSPSVNNINKLPDELLPLVSNKR